MLLSSRTLVYGSFCNSCDVYHTIQCNDLKTWLFAAVVCGVKARKRFSIAVVNTTGQVAWQWCWRSIVFLLYGQGWKGLIIIEIPEHWSWVSQSPCNKNFYKQSITDLLLFLFWFDVWNILDTFHFIGNNEQIIP